MDKHAEHKLCLDFVRECDEFHKKCRELQPKYSREAVNDKLEEDVMSFRRKYLPDSWDEDGFYLRKDGVFKVKYFFSS